MKKILYAIGLVAPLLATSVSASVSDFFANEETTLKVVCYYDGEERVMARVKGTLLDENHIVAFKLESKLSYKSWENDDEALEATPTDAVGLVDVGQEKLLRMKAPYGPISYKALDDTEELQGDLTPESTVSVHTVQNWLRPDNTTYSIVGDVLFRLRLKEDREVVGGEFKTLVRAWEEIKCRGFKSKKATRHLIQNYSQEKVTLTTTKLMSDRDEVIGEPTVVEFIALTKTGSYESWSNEASLSAGVVPNGYKVVS